MAGLVEIPYGRAEDGRIVHVSEVPSGGVRACFCLECGERLLAYKGPLKAHHFQHRSNQACPGASETALHLLAKEVLSKNRLMRLPPVIAQHAEMEARLRDATDFAYDETRIEQGKDGVQPDVLLLKGGRELAVEIYVTHRCETQKLAFLKARKLATIEIDLSRLPRNSDPEIVCEAVLWSAPREWLFNRHIEDVEDRLRDHAADLAERERRRRELAYGPLAIEVAEMYQRPQTMELDLIRFAEDAGLGNLIGLPVEGDRCFRVDTRSWQAAIVHFLYFGPGQYDRFLASSVTAYLESRRFFANAIIELRSGCGEAVDHVAATVPRFRRLQEVVDDYLGRLLQVDAVLCSRKWWRVRREQAYEAQQRQREVSGARERLAQLDERISAIRKEATGARGFKWRRWLSARCEQLDASPMEVARAGGLKFQSLLSTLDSFLQMLRPGGYALPVSFLGLPLEPDREARRAEAHQAREERQAAAAKLEEERQAVAAKLEEERLKKEQSNTREFLATFVADAFSLLGDCAAEWVHDRLGGRTAEDANLLLTPEQRDRLAGTLAAEAERRATAVRLAAQCQELLASDAYQSFKWNRERAELWLSSRHPGLDGRSPRATCVDEPSFRRCVALLRPPTRR
jgi:hypothetical protein